MPHAAALIAKNEIDNFVINSASRCVRALWACTVDLAVLGQAGWTVLDAATENDIINLPPDGGNCSPNEHLGFMVRSPPPRAHARVRPHMMRCICAQVALSRQQLYGAGAATDGGPAVFLGRVIAYHPVRDLAPARVSCTPTL